MAAEPCKSKEKGDFMICPMCAKVLTDPKVLPCGHRYCRNCLLKYCDVSAAQQFIIKSEVLDVIPCGEPGEVLGIALLGRKLFVCTDRDRSEQVGVYDVKKLKTQDRNLPIRSYTVPGLKQPGSLAVCQQHSCLYISDYKSKCINRVDLSNSSCTSWSLNADPRGVSLTRAFNLLVTLPQSIEEYTTSGSLIRSIKLDASIDNPRYAIELSGGELLICHMGKAQHRVCVVDTAGRIVHSYGGPPGSSAGQLKDPRSLAVDSRGYVLVADYHNKRIQVLNPTLNYIGDVATPGHELNGSWALHLDEDNGRLYVGEELRACVLVLLST